MNISGIRTYAGFYDYNTLRNDEIRSQQIQETKLERDVFPQKAQTGSVMKSEQVLQQYQFFIGEKKAGEELETSEDKENFSL